MNSFLAFPSQIRIRDDYFIPPQIRINVIAISPYPHINLSIFYLVLHRLGICMDGPVINPCLYRLGVDVKSRAISTQIRNMNVEYFALFLSRFLSQHRLGAQVKSRTIAIQIINMCVYFCDLSQHRLLSLYRLGLCIIPTISLYPHIG